jgi:hypothetical protein
MPEESIAAYINNIVTFTIFIVILVSVFAILFLISRILVRRNIEEKNAGIEKAQKEIGWIGNADADNYRTDPYLRKNAFMLGTVFVNIIVFLILALAVLDYALRPSIGLSFYLIAGVLLYLILMVVYLIRSRIVN